MTPQNQQNILAIKVKVNTPLSTYNGTQSKVIGESTAKCQEEGSDHLWIISLWKTSGLQFYFIFVMYSLFFLLVYDEGIYYRKCVTGVFETLHNDEPGTVTKSYLEGS